ncbi:putative polygalacturonase At3g15720 [Nicotiana tabacum]|uniref:Polygalacturonase At3g15720 n=1 Tax=Nicotiana tabacum TaxID=4097 RepID=A0A1S4AY91_TOBAC
MKMLISYFLALLLLPSLVFSVPDFPVFNVLDYGAVGDGLTDTTNAFNKTWEATCTSLSSSPTMYIPFGNTFLIHPLILSGPCVSPGVTIEINGNIVAPIEPSEWTCLTTHCDKWIYIKHVNGLTVRGNGTINGRGQKWWDVNDRRKPTAFDISHCQNISVSGLSFKDNPHVHFHIENSESATVSNITIDAPAKSPNTDGIHLSSSRDVSINHCRIGTGEDCISIVDGCSNLKISNIICGPGHGISIGSLGKHGSNDTVENVLVSDVVFIKSTNGARIKTWQGGQGYARNIIFERILSQDSHNPIIIDQFYCDHENCTEHDLAVQVSGITFRQILGTSQGEFAVKLDCSAKVPCTGILMEDIYIRSGTKREAKSYINSAHGFVKGQNLPEIRL